MTEERKKYIHEFYTELYKLHKDYADIDNAADDSADQWDRYCERVNSLMRDIRLQGATHDDLEIMRALISSQLALIEKHAIAKAGVAA